MKYWVGTVAVEVNAVCVTVASVFKPFIKWWWHLTQIRWEDTPPSAEWCIIFIMVREDWDITHDICYYHDSWQICPTIQITQADSVVVSCIHGGFVSLVLDRTDGVWWTHHLLAHEFWQNIGMNHFNAIPQTSFTVMHDFCTCWECAGVLKKEQDFKRSLMEVQLCGFVLCKRAEALVV